LLYEVALKSLPLTRTALSCALVAALFLAGALHAVLLNGEILHVPDSSAHAGASSGSGCCLFVCTSVIISILALTVILFKLNGQTASPVPVALPAELPLFDPPPRVHLVTRIAVSR
jgi:hypothetical protein